MDFMKNTLSQVNVEEETLYDFIYDLVFFMALNESEDDIKNGRLYTLEEFDAEMEAKYESYHNPANLIENEFVKNLE